MGRLTLQATAFAMPRTSPAIPPDPYCFVDREHFIIRDHTTGQVIGVDGGLAITWSFSRWALNFNASQPAWRSSASSMRPEPRCGMHE
jgi:hypothetical protein